MILTALVALLPGAPAAFRARQRRQSAALHAAQARFWSQVARRAESRGATDGDSIAAPADRPAQVARAVEAAKDYRRAAAYHEGQRRAFADGW